MKKYTKNIFIQKSINVHGDLYDYSLVEYVNCTTKVKIICAIHGIFEQTPDNHIHRKSKCPFCSGKKLNTYEFIKKAVEIHDNNYIYLLVEYINNYTKVKIICPIHGIFEMLPSNHLSQKQGCPVCSGNKPLTNEEYVEKAIKRHVDKYDYSLVEYISTSKKVKIICPIHGIFEQNSLNHLQGAGCPMCSESKGEKIITHHLLKNKIKYITQHKFNDCKDKRRLPFDFYLPELNTCIEYDGIQHFKPIEFFGGMSALNENKKRDKIKTDYCINNGINLLRIKYTEDVNEKLKNF